eukprot:CAMPEP_0176029608 /NCGR_PEP_ID=MMETSP0120_2-20121206/14551_1 /TAXON_ID=160619 /ORGANISM="Kryptoperidinium foliaceum, Strain CCMP 1326" /LENGTH=135 /DNA_ID=CAMNT_0017362835 /DNA_START=264 /DNA_END=667 /DNA_ORIENTATION=+
MQQTQVPMLSPRNRLTVKTALTPTTHDSSTPMSYSSAEGSFARRSDQSSSERSSRSIRVPLPSPTRARLDQRYAKRLAAPSPISTTTANASTPPLAPSSASSAASAPGRLVPPPGINRESSLFRPTSIIAAHSPT